MVEISTRHRGKMKFVTGGHSSPRKSPRGSLNITARREAARRMDEDNVGIATRITQRKAALARSGFDKEQRKVKTTADTALQIDKLVEK